MGTFEGHVLPGSMFLVFGVWWTLRIAQIRAEQYSNGRRRSAGAVSNSYGKIRVIFPCQCAPHLPIEAGVKIVLSFLGILIEIHSSLSYEVLHAGDVQHVTMYTMFFISGIVDIFTFYKIFVPMGVDYFIGAMSFIIEGILFYYHIEHQAPFEQMVHIMLIVAIFGCVLASFLEACNAANIEIKYLRAFFVLLQGTWFYQVGFLIYNPVPGSNHPWHGPGKGMDKLWVSMMFAWHCIFIFAFQFVLSAIVWFSWNGKFCQMEQTNFGSPVEYKKLTREKAEEEVSLIDESEA